MSSARGQGGAPRAFRRLRRAAAGLALAALSGGLGSPLLEAALAPELAAFCGRDGRCCCAGPGRDTGEAPCLSRACGCGRPDGDVPSVLHRTEAVLPTPTGPAPPAPRRHAPAEPPSRVLGRPHAPPVPPPKPTLSA
jgi:hypothetical protein